MRDIHATLDLEAMGTQADAAIVAIGACAIDISSGTFISEFYTTVNLDSSTREGGTINPRTVIWWMEQEEIARHQLTDGSGVDILDALDEFSAWVYRLENGSPKEGRATIKERQVQLWGNGVDFDNVILSSAYTNCKIDQPWTYKQNNCYRTLKKLYPEVEAAPSTVPHHAAYDARAQALHLIKLLHAAGISGPI